MNKYALVNKSNIIVSKFANTTDSIYAVDRYTTTKPRRFRTRSAARTAKQAYKTPTNYAIIDTIRSVVVR